MIRVGILGTGFGENHAKLYKNIDGFEVVSIFGRNTDKLKKINEELGVPVTTDISEIVQNPAIDLLDICLPTELHAKWAVEGLKNNKHIFCETPLTYLLDEVDKIKQASMKYGKNVYVDMFIKFSAPHKTALMFAKKAELGKLISIASYNKTSARWGDLSIKKNIEEFHIHNMDFISEIAGVPENVTVSFKDFGSKSFITSVLDYKNVYAIMQSDSTLPECCPFGIGFELVFTEGIIKFDAIYGEYTKEDFYILQNGKQREVLPVESTDDYEETFKHVLLCLQNGVKSEIIDVENALNTIKIKEMILRSLNI